MPPLTAYQEKVRKLAEIIPIVLQVELAANSSVTRKIEHLFVQHTMAVCVISGDNNIETDPRIGYCLANSHGLICLFASNSCHKVADVLAPFYASVHS